MTSPMESLGAAHNAALRSSSTDYRALARSFSRTPKQPTDPVFKPVVAEPWSLPKAKVVVKARSGGRCELGGPTCLLVAHDVDHVFGRGGADPHNPDGLLHLCGFGNANGGCHQWVSQTRVGRAASIAVVEAIAGVS